jgi:hypothetical protein
MAESLVSCIWKGQKRSSTVTSHIPLRTSLQIAAGQYCLSWGSHATLECTVCASSQCTLDRKQSKNLINESLPNRILRVVLIPSTFPVVTRGVVWGWRGMMVTWPYLFLDPSLWMSFVGEHCSSLIFWGIYCALLIPAVLYEDPRRRLWNMLYLRS